MKKTMICGVSMLLLLFCACGRTSEPPPDAAQTTERPTAEDPVAADEMPRLASGEVPIGELVIVELPSAEATDRTMICLERSGDAARYQDVSERKNVLAVPATYGAVGETVSVTPGIYGQVALCAVDLRFTYDASLLRFVGYEAEDGDALLLNGEERGVIYANYLLPRNATEGFDLCRLDFQVLTAEPCDAVIGAEVVEMVALVGADIVGCDYSIVPGVIHLNSESG